MLAHLSHFSCKLSKNISNFKNVFDLYSQIGIVTVCFDIKKIGIFVYTTHDKNIHTMATFSSSTFFEYRCEKEYIFTLNIKHMKENLKNITVFDTVELFIKNECELGIKVVKKTIEFEKSIPLKEAQIYELPIVLDQIQPLNIKSADFLEFCRNILNSKCVVTVKTENKCPEISFKFSAIKVIIKSDNENIDALSQFEGEFKAEYFCKLKKFTKFNSSMRIYASKCQPLIFEINIGTKDKIAIWIKSIKQMEEDYDEGDDN